MQVIDLVGSSGATSKMATEIVEHRKKEIGYNQKKKNGKSQRNTSVHVKDLALILVKKFW